MQALHNVAERLSELHAAGYVHGDIKPGNAMWLPRKKRWTLIDFGTAVTIGATVTNTFTIPYAAPEVLYAKVHHGDLIQVSTAADAWSLGVLAVELLAGKAALRTYKSSTRREVRKLFCCACSGRRFIGCVASLPCLRSLGCHCELHPSRTASNTKLVSMSGISGALNTHFIYTTASLTPCSRVWLYFLVLVQAFG